MAEPVRAGVYDWVMVISVILGYIDQATDILFILDSRSVDRWFPILGTFFTLFFHIVSVARALLQGRGLGGALLAASGLELAVRAWQAYRERSQDARQRWKEVADYISIESRLEGIPLIFTAVVYLYVLMEPCLFLTCDSVTIRRVFPSHVLTLPPTPPLTSDDVRALHRQEPRCSQLPLTLDGWFTAEVFQTNEETIAENRSLPPLHRSAEFEITGSVLSDATGTARNSSTCVGSITRFPENWSTFAPDPVPRGSVIALLSIYCGILCAAYHLTRTSSTDTATSLWAIPEPLRDATHATATPATADPATQGAAAAPLRVSGNDDHRPGLRNAAADNRVHPVPEEELEKTSVARADVEPRPADPGEQGARPGSGGRRARGVRGVLRHIGGVLAAGVSPVAAHQSAAFLCFLLDVTFMVSLWGQIPHTIFMAFPYLSLFSIQLVAIFLAALVKGWIVVGRFGWPLLAVAGQMLWTVTPVRVSNAWVLRAAPRWGPYAAVSVSIAWNGALLAAMTAIVASMKRGERYAWRVSWRPLTLLWVLYLTHVAMMWLGFWTHTRVMRGVRAARARTDACDDGDGKCCADDAAVEENPVERAERSALAEVVEG